MQVKPIEWSDAQLPNKEINYNHVVGKTPLGDILITWKAWKEDPYYTIDESPFGWLNGGYSLGDAKQVAQDAYGELVLSCLIPDAGNEAQ